MHGLVLLPNTCYRRNQYTGVDFVRDTVTSLESCPMLKTIMGSMTSANEQRRPLFNGDNPPTVPFGGPDGLWCEPVGTLHHVTLEEMSSLWQWTNSSTNKELVSRICHSDRTTLTIRNLIWP